MASLLTRALLVLVCGFAALSSSAAAALGLAEERDPAVHAVLVWLLLLLPFLLRPRLAGRAGPSLLLAAAGLDRAGRPPAAASTRRRQVALPVLVLLAGAQPRPRFLPPEQLTRFVWRLLSGYVARDLPLPAVAEPAGVARGYEGIVRYDPTGSVVMHSSLSLIHLILAATRLGQPLTAARAPRDPGRWAACRCPWCSSPPPGPPS